MRSILLIAFICGFLGTPALCAAGAFTHPCECGESIECSHEDDCNDDPCVDVLAIPRTGHDTDSPVVLADAVTEALPPMQTGMDRPFRTPPGVPRLNLPCPDSVLPLLN